MNWQTLVHIPVSERKLRYEDTFLSLGSCFADNMSHKLRSSFFRVCANPFGTLYNPMSIARCFGEKCDYVLEHNQLFHSMFHHGSFSSSTLDELQARTDASWQVCQRAIEEASVVIVTWGTAWVYTLDGVVVANCHKIPAQRFDRRRLTVEEIVEVWQEIIHRYEDKYWIFTVSPIRHVKDGMHENQLSKAVLLSAVDALQRCFPSRVGYFPAYEIMMDELRDYRFYADDMLHPSDAAVAYIWQRFVETMMKPETVREMACCEQLYRDLNHRPLHPESEAYRLFREGVEERCRQMTERYPWLESDLKK